MPIRLALLVAVLASCFLFAKDTARLDVAATAPVDIRMGCALAESRCTRCHPIDRVLNARVISPAHWEAYVHRMRLQPQSGIMPDEESPILRCLVYRSFGQEGLAALPAEHAP